MRNRIKNAVFNGRSARKKPYLKKDRERKRLAYAKKLLNNFFDAKDSENVLYTDEASVMLHGNSGNVSVRRRPNEAFHEKCTVPTFRSNRQSLMVWSSISANGVGKMHFCTDSVTGEYYRNMLHEEIPITRELLLLPEKVWFVQDGAPAHRAKATKAVVKELSLDDLGHPPQSPDLNPIENLWAVMKRELHKNSASSIDDLKLGQIWYSIDKVLVRNILMSIPGRLESVVKQKDRDLLDQLYKEQVEQYFLEKGVDWKSPELTQRLLAVLDGTLKQGTAQWYVIKKQYVTNVDDFFSKVEREFIPADLQERLRESMNNLRERIAEISLIMWATFAM
uniref:Tc1like transporase putative n=1 Tax=Albugo laibachii Nc14 TaxID=890382 RepID=F0X1I8_9STRA|nr:Tc1like transporase putative [Albugo laibachii Nc14]|eukprot:CCA27675.1 Tc1like transporase putative [Albugo laibachii Nc14]